MAVTERDEDRIEYAFIMAFSPELPENDETADKALKAWNLLWELMERENNFSNQLGSSVLDWQIGNWANDITVLLHNAKRYKDVIAADVFRDVSFVTSSVPLSYFLFCILFHPIYS